MKEKIILASANRGKFSEIRAILQDKLIVPQADLNVPEVEETGLTFVENAIIKARNACRHTGLAALADDSGIEVDALGGNPGVFSARFAGQDADDHENLEKLLAEMRPVADGKRQARFRCVTVYLRHDRDPSPIIGQGVWAGTILHEPIGENGFGYDPIFFVAEENCSSAQLAPAVKNRLSHRGKSLRQLVGQLK